MLLLCNNDTSSPHLNSYEKYPIKSTVNFSFSFFSKLNKFENWLTCQSKCFPFHLRQTSHNLRGCHEVLHLKLYPPNKGWLSPEHEKHITFLVVEKSKGQERTTMTEHWREKLSTILIHTGQDLITKRGAWLKWMN